MQVRVAALAGAVGVLLGLAATAQAARTPVSATRPVASSAPAAATTVSIVLKEWSIRVSARSVPAGKVTFVVRNAGTMKHEFVVVRTNKAANALPLKGTEASEVGAKGEIAEFGPGVTKRLTLTLAPGKYVLICNLAGHYKAGQRLAFTVTAASSSASTSPAQTTNVSVSAFEMGFKLSKATVACGTVVFDVRNDGKLAHDFSFGSRGGGTPLIQPGESAALRVTFAKPGKYTFICTVEGHQEAGMFGVLTVAC